MLVCVGSVAYDIIEVPHRAPVEVLGGSATWFCTAASFFAKPYLIGVVGDDFREEDRAFLEHRGVDLTGLERRKGATFRWHGRYFEDMQKRDSLMTELGVFAEFRPVVPAQMRNPDVLFLGNIEPDLQGLVMAQCRKAGFVGLDTIECWMQPPHRERLLRLLPQVDLLFVNDEEVRILSGEQNVVRAATRILRDFGPRAVVVKRGENGAMLFMLEHAGKGLGEERQHARIEIRLFPAFPLAAVIDPTGAGDSFAGGVLGYLERVGCTDAETLVDAMAVGTVVASLAVEGFGPRHFDKVSFLALAERAQQYARMVGFRQEEVLRNISLS